MSQVADAGLRPEQDRLAELPERIHCVGVGGGGLAPLACLLAARGHRLSGSDRVAARPELQAAGVVVSQGHAEQHLGDAQLVIRSAAVGDDNPEVVAARRLGLPVLKYSEALGRLMRGRRGVALAGTHGKTTCTALLAWLLDEAGARPSWIVGGTPVGARAWGSGASDLLLVEACEYDRSFLNLDYELAVVTGVSPDHLDCFGDASGVEAAFRDFATRVPPHGQLVLGPDVHRGFATTLGFVRSTPQVCWVDDALPLAELHEDEAGYHGVLVADGERVAFDLPVMGRHNVDHLRTALVVARGLGLGLDFESLLQAAAGFRGVRRRLEDLGLSSVLHGGPPGLGVRVVDDFAHHPEALHAAAAALRSRFPGRRVVGVFQPHQVSRTEDFLPDFVAALSDFDRVALCDIFVARDTHPERADELCERLSVQAGDHVARVGPAPRADGAVADMLRPGDVCVVMGAGDVEGLAPRLVGEPARS